MQRKRMKNGELIYEEKKEMENGHSFIPVIVSDNMYLDRAVSIREGQTEASGCICQFPGTDRI